MAIRSKFGNCQLCNRSIALTFHHLIPRKCHGRRYFQKNYSKEERNQGIDVCRKCHKGIHKLFDEMRLGKEFNTLEKLQQQPEIQKHCRWVSKQKA